MGQFNEEEINIIRLIRTNNIGPITFYKLLEQFGNATNTVKYLSKQNNIQIYSVEKAINEITLAKEHNATIITFNHPNYPPLLKHTVEAPPLLFAKGNLNLLKKTAIAIVGSRNSSINGKRKAYEYALQCGKNGFVVVSGLATGIDTAVHEGSLQNGTIAVLATGLDVVYPKENAILQNQIAEYGCLITETPFNTVTLPSNFPKRNRIISGISRGVLVIEARKNSGSLITANLALEQNREVFVIPGDIDDGKYYGSNMLIQQGKGLLVQNILDIISQLKQNIKILQEKEYIFNATTNYDTILDEEVKKARAIILDNISYSAVNIDLLLQQTKLKYSCFNIALLELEISGCLQRVSNNCIVKIKNEN